MQSWVNSEIGIGIGIGIEIDFWSAKVIGIGTDLKVIRIGIKNWCSWEKKVSYWFGSTLISTFNFTQIT